MSETVDIVCPHCDTVNRASSKRLSGGIGGKCGACGKPLFAGRPLTLNGERFERHAARNGIPLVVDFWAEWCGPCKTMAPMFEAAAKNLEPRVRLAKVDTDVEQELAARFHIRSIPTLLLLKNGNEIARTSGAMDSGTIMRWVAQHL